MAEGYLSGPFSQVVSKNQAYFFVFKFASLVSLLLLLCSTRAQLYLH